MRTLIQMLAALALNSFAVAQPQVPAKSAVAAEIAAIEQAWGQAFLDGDEAFLQALVAPEFELMRAEGGQTLFTPRAQWFANYQSYIFHDFQVRTVDVIEAGDTAVATITGRWKVGLQGREGTREEGFIVSDTFVRRGGRWQVIHRHSTPFPLPPPPTIPVGTNERG